MKNKLICCLCVFFAIIVLFPNYALASYDDNNQSTYINYEIGRGDEIIIKYRMYNGNLQYRHWNATRNCWVEDHWIDA